MGNRSNASSEVEFAQAWAHLVGEEGRGVHTIIEMVNHTRLDCAIAAAGLMRQALAQAVHHARHRRAFGKLLIEQPLMRNVLADLAIESEAATLLMVRLARSFDARESDARERAFCRIATAIAKYWLCKRSPVHVGEALECLGGNGYVEESIMPRLYREAPLYSIWEGSGNVICLDVLRALAKDPATVEALLAELKSTAGADKRLDSYVAGIQARLSDKAGNGSLHGYGVTDMQPGNSRKDLRWRCRLHWWSGTARRRSPMRSLLRGWPDNTARLLGHWRRKWMWMESLRRMDHVKIYCVDIE